MYFVDLVYVVYEIYYTSVYEQKCYLQQIYIGIMVQKATGL